ncbi:MAG: hypothetical protein BRC23_00930 [Parcubacteria group bacterium SW_4_49_11]|nr:MAG: hypothetical protein BRC23_00930 [Parcubacteria group bacterium SW_4_49_11]
MNYLELLPVLQDKYPDRFNQMQEVSIETQGEAQEYVEALFSAKEIAQEYAEHEEYPFIDLESAEYDRNLYFEYPEKSMAMYKFFPFKKDGDTVHVAMADPESHTARQAVKFMFRNKKEDYKIFVATEQAIDGALKSVKSISYDVLQGIGDEEDTEDKMEEEPNEDKESYQLEDAPASKIVSVILKNAIDGGASDVHIEGQEENVRVRFRVDGILHTSLILPKNVQSAVVSRLKILSDMKIDEHRRPQDGRFKIIHQGHKIDFRVSTLPTAYGEKVVARILDTSEGIKSLPTLGFRGPKAKHVENSIEAPYGITLVTGPTGSGKSTTLYTLLSMVKSEKVNIVTLEDPVEYYISGVNQSQVHAEIGYTFASGLRSILRQDPDIMMVGEIRDGETAGLAVQSALTGHLVFSTLHTNDSVGAVPRLIDMGVEPFLLSASINLIIAQRLVRTLCERCKVKVEMGEERRAYIQETLERLSDELINELYDGDFSTLWAPQGCEQCSNGYKGRVAIFEALAIDSTMRANIEKGFNEDEFTNYIYANDFMTLKQDGMMKVLNGDTSLEELMRQIET